MSDFGKALFDLLPVHSALQDKNNPGRKVIDNTIGEWFDHHDINEFYDNLFLNTATGAYLDLFGRDYGIGRRLDEGDDDYRLRIIQEKNDNLTPSYLKELFDLDLFVYVADYDATKNMLTSDNPYITASQICMIETDLDTMKLLNHKFILENNVTFLFDDVLHYIWQENFILNTGMEYVLGDYLDVYTASNLNNYFKNKNWFKYVKLLNLQGVGGSHLFESCGGLTSVVLSAPNMTSGSSAFRGCGHLVSVDLDLPSVTDAGIMFRSCEKLENVTANLPSLSNFINMFAQSTKIKYINVNIPANKVTAFTDYVTGLNLHYLTTLIINGEEVDLS